MGSLQAHTSAIGCLGLNPVASLQPCAMPYTRPQSLMETDKAIMFNTRCMFTPSQTSKHLRVDTYLDFLYNTAKLSSYFKHLTRSHMQYDAKCVECAKLLVTA